MALTKKQKTEKIKELEEKLSKQKSAVFIGFEKIKTKEMSNLRKQLKASGAEFCVAKKTLANIAFLNKGIKAKSEDFANESGIVFGYEDELSPVKIIREFQKKNKNLKIFGGILENKFITDKEALALAQIPPREILYSKVVSSIASPMANFLNVCQGNIRGLMQVLSSIKK